MPFGLWARSIGSVKNADKAKAATKTVKFSWKAGKVLPDAPIDDLHMDLLV